MHHSMSGHYYIGLFIRIALGLLVGPPALNAGQSAYSQGYQLRCDSIVKYCSGSKAPLNCFTVMTQLAKATQDTGSMRFLDSMLQNPSRGMFWMYQVAGIYFYGKKNLSRVWRKKIVQAFSSCKVYRGETENHWLLYYSSMYLFSGEALADSCSWFNGKTNAQNREEAKAWIQRWMKKSFSEGLAEYDSPHYGIWYIVPLFMLFDFTGDPVFKRQCEIMLYRLLADQQTDYRNGVITGACSRVLDRNIFAKQNSQMAQVLGFFEGDKPLFSPAWKPLNLDYHMAIFALSSFAFPEILAQVWQEQNKQSFETIEKQRTTRRFRYYETSEEPFRKYSWITPAFTLGSVSKNGSEGFQTRSWSLDWKGTGAVTTCFGLHPFYGAHELAAFFPGPEHLVYQLVLHQRPFYNSPDKWIGASPFENLFQDKNVLVGLYDFPDTASNKCVCFFLPEGLDSLWFGPDSALYVMTGSICFSIRFSAPPLVMNTAEGKRLSIRGDKPGFILEVIQRNEVSSFQDFLIKSGHESFSFSSKAIRFRALDKRRIEFDLQGNRRVGNRKNGTDPETVLGAPGLYLKGTRMEIRANDQELTLDYAKLEITNRHAVGH